MATPAGSAAAGVPRPGPEDPSAPAPGASQGPAPGALGEPPAAPLPPPPPAPPLPPPGPAGAPGPGPAAGLAGGPPTAPQQPSPAEAKYPAGPAQGQPPPLPPPPGPAAPPPAGPSAAPAPPAPPPPPPGQEDYSFLPLVHDVIKCMDKDSQDVHQVLNELRTKFVEMRKLVKSLQGIGVSPEQQQLQLQNLREQVKTKSELLQKYKSLCMFEIPKE